MMTSQESMREVGQLFSLSASAGQKKICLKNELNNITTTTNNNSNNNKAVCPERCSSSSSNVQWTEVSDMTNPAYFVEDHLADD